MFVSFGFPELIIAGAIAMSALTVAWPSARICARAGFSPWIGLLAVVPIANVVLLWFVAFARWPAVTAGVGWRPSSGR